MRFIFFILSTLLGTLFFCDLSYAQVNVVQVQPLRFGEILVDPAGDTITLRQNGNITSANGSDLQGGEDVAIFRIEGPRNTSVAYSFSTNNTLSANGENVTLDNFVANRPNPFNLPGSGVREIQVGADLIIPPALNGGSFSGTFGLTIENQ